MLDKIIIGTFSAGFLISIISIVYLLLKFANYTRINTLLIIYIFFLFSFIAGIFSVLYIEAIDLVALFEALAFFVMYYNYIKRNIFMGLFLFSAIGDIFLVISLYFVTYDLFMFYKRRSENNVYTLFMAFIFFTLSILIELINTVYYIKILYIMSYIILDIGLLLFSMPFYKLLSEKNEKKQNVD